MWNGGQTDYGATRVDRAFRRDLPLPDALSEGSIIAIGELLSRGGILYRDVKTFVMPLTYELMGLLYWIFGPSILVGRLFLLGAFALVVVFAHRILLKVVSPPAALLGALALWPIKPLAFPLWNIVNYSQVALLFLIWTMLAATNWFSTQRVGWLIATGVLIGMTVVSKQDFGAHIALAIGLAMVFDWWIRRPLALRSLLANLAVLGLSATLPLVVTLSYYGWHGVAGSLIDRTVFGPLLVPGKYDVAFPGFQYWADTPENLSLVVFAYFPAAFIEMAWSGDFNVYDRTQLLPLELAIKGAYYLPILAMAGVAAMALRRGVAAQRSTLVLIATAAAIAYLLVYRADWTHLMNLYAIAILPVIVALGHWAATGQAWRGIVAGAVLLAWFAFGTVATDGILERYDTPIETARGRILAVPREAEEITKVLDYVAAEPPSSRVVFLPYSSLFYFLTGRPIITPNDLVMPALVAGDRDDRELAEAVERADVVIFNPKIFPTVQTPLYGYAPRTATVLSSLFDRERELTNAAVVLRKARTVESTVVSDLWAVSGTDSIEPLREPAFWGDEGIAGLPPVFRDHWMVYRVVAVRTEPEEEQCFQRRHCVDAGQWLTAVPVTHSDAWGLKNGKNVRFDVRARHGDAVHLLKSITKSSSEGPERVRISLRPLSGQCIEFSFCATALEEGLPRGVAGWAEPRIVADNPETAPASP
jgi:hypothetical protein